MFVRRIRRRDKNGKFIKNDDEDNDDYNYEELVISDCAKYSFLVIMIAVILIILGPWIMIILNPERGILALYRWLFSWTCPGAGTK